jgi:hypothetical protein
MAITTGPAPDPRALGVSLHSRMLVTRDLFEVGIAILPTMGSEEPPLFLSVYRPARDFTVTGPTRRSMIESLLAQLNDQLAIETLEGR